MALNKPKTYDWKDSNLALFGSDTDRQVKKDSACTEPAWEGAGTQVGIRIWRIVKFKVTEWPKKDYGHFFSGDSYIVLNTYKDNDGEGALAHDVHFWIGSQSTQDEYGTAAYKTVELDTFLDDVPIQHREVQGHESQLFRSYFPSIMIMEGGAETGFRHVEPRTYQPRLFHFHGDRKSVRVQQVPLCRKSMDSSDVFILDLGLRIIQWNGDTANHHEKFKGMEWIGQLKTERGAAKSEVVEEDELSDESEFYSYLTGDADPGYTEQTETEGPVHLYRISDSTGSLQIQQVKMGDVTTADLESDDVFIIDNGAMCFVWVGKGASPAEKLNGFGYAHKHLMQTSHRLVPVVVVKEGQRNKEFNRALCVAA